MIDMDRRQKSAPDIGIAPLVDCVFLLLIFFLLTSSFSTQRAITITLPSSSTAVGQEKGVIEIAVSGKGEIEFNGRIATLEDLVPALRHKVQQQDKKPVLLVADRQVSLEIVTKLIDAVRAAGLESVSIATRRDRTDAQIEQEAEK